MLWISVLTMSFQLRLSADEISFEYSISLSIPALSSTNRNVFSTLEEALPNAEKLEKLIKERKEISSITGFDIMPPLKMEGKPMNDM